MVDKFTTKAKSINSDPTLLMIAQYTTITTTTTSHSWWVRPWYRHNFISSDMTPVGNITLYGISHVRFNTPVYELNVTLPTMQGKCRLNLWQQVTSFHFLAGCRFWINCLTQGQKPKFTRIVCKLWTWSLQRVNKCSRFTSSCQKVCK